MSREILILDDDVETQRMLAAVLSPLGFSVAVARRIREARALIENKQFELLVVDGLLPDGNGAAFISGLRRTNYVAKVVFISSFFRGIDQYSKLTRELGVDLVLAKPFSAQEFLFQVRPLLALDSDRGEARVDEDQSRPISLSEIEPPSSPPPPPPTDEQESLRLKLAELHAAYTNALQKKVDELSEALGRVRAALAEDGGMDQDALTTARMLSHKMHGTAGSYGFGAISDAAALIEHHVVALIDGDAPADVSPDAERWSEVDRWTEVDGALARIREEVAKGTSGEHAAATEFADAGLAADRQANAQEPLIPGTSLAASTTTLLVVDDDEDFLARMSQMGEQSVTRVLTARNGAEAVDRARAHEIDAAIIDVLLEDDESPQDVAEKLRLLPGQHALPLAFISGDGRLRNRIAAVHAGVSLFLNKPLTQEEFVEAIHQLSTSSQERRPRVLIVDDDPLCTEPLRTLLDVNGYDPEVLHDATQIVEQIEQLRPDLLLLDLVMPDVSGFDICKIVRANPSWHIPLVAITGQTSPEVRVAAFAAGADDFLVKPIIKEELLVRLRLRLEQARQARDRSDRDPLTGLFSRRAFIRAFPLSLGEVKRRQTVLSVCLIDLDHFKVINDTYGHLAGDRVLAHFGRMLSIRFRGTDMRCRWGGEEFIVVFVGEDEGAAAEILDRVRQEFHDVIFTGDNGHAFSASFSAGISSYPRDGKSLEDLLRVADERLYSAKHGGRAQTHTGQYLPVNRS